ncbi:SLC13 family permease [Vibrio cincinnatiensis]|uniref:SLC13 family permease n=1 Tax=Vibrio cincinnatiensis TaxID=675 RepID=UPI001EE09C49|nr:SLC13 family permease [Vibrio cincinnatiensis]MCG3732795.1 SLC13 family permease [Vibrio cincinnatiensis]MCG3739020.1 SLC13 family permease [Vibrio cincinnatiensis]MCG3741924.1 SLC13 family permease [Vibrio cincinnatiensis]
MFTRISTKQVLIIGVLLSSALMVMFPFSGHPLNFSYSAAVVLLTLALWSTGALPPFLTGLIFFSLAVIFQLAEPSLLFSGFSSTAVWLIISGFVIGAAISSSGLGDRVAALIAPFLTLSYSRLILGLVVMAMALGFVMPSSVGRAVVLVPIGMALAERVGFSKGSNGRIGIAVALAIACNMPSFAVLPSNIPNMILAGSSETLFGLHFGYTEYLLLHFPILGIVKSLFLVWLVLRLFPAEITRTEAAEATSLSYDRKQQKKVIVLLGMTLFFWVTDSIHGVNPAWVGLATAVILLMPKLGVVEPKSFNRSIDFATVVFVAAALGLGALVNVSGLGAAMGELFSHLLPTSSDHGFLSFMALSLISTLTGLVATIPGVPTVLSPMAADFAQASGFSLSAVLMTQVIGFSTVIFPYQVGPLIVAMQLSNESLAKLVKVTLPLAGITVALLMPLDYLWWLLLGWI